jgi:hypothetical protein
MFEDLGLDTLTAPQVAVIFALVFGSAVGVLARAHPVLLSSQPRGR